MVTQIRLLGRPLVEVTGQLSKVLKSAKGLALLTYLVVTKEAHSREVIADLLWDAPSTAQSLNNLRQLLSRMKGWLPDLEISATDVAYRASGFVDLYEVWVGLSADSAPTLDEALQLYCGDLLANFYVPDAPRFNEWLLLEREQLRQRIIVAYQQLCEIYAEQAEWARGLAVAQRWLTLDELDETALQHLLQFLAATGQIELALQQYEISKKHLWTELAVEPEPETVHLAQRLQSLRDQQGGGVSWAAIVGAQMKCPPAHELAEPGNLPTNAYVPYQRNHDFTGRRESLLHLASLLLPQTEAKQQRAVAVTGMGGLGKTQIAVEFCYRYGRYFPGGVFWLSFADADSVANEAAVIGGERGLGLYRDADKLTQLDKVGRVRRAWQEAVPRLLIFDNCEAEALLAEWLPVTGGCQVLLTSRRGVWTPELGVVIHALTRLDRAESVQLLQQLVAHIDGDNAADIASEVGDLPLALYLAGSFLRRYQQIQPEAYLYQLRQQGRLQHPSLLGRGATHSPTGHELDIARTFALNFEQLDPADDIDAMAQKLLACTIAFAHGEPIPQQLLLNCILITSDDLLAKLLAMDGLTRLLALGLLRSVSGEQVHIHRLVAEFAAVELGEALLQGGRTAVEDSLITLLTNQNKGMYGLATLPLASAHLNHVIEKARQRADKPAIQLLLLWGCHQRDRGLYEAAEHSFQLAAQLQEQLDDLADLEKIELLDLLGNLYIRMGRYRAAQSCFEQYLAILEQTPDTRPLTLARGFNEQGLVYASLGKFEVAQGYLEKAVTLYKENLGPDEPSYEYYLSNLAVFYFWKGNYQGAWQLTERNLRAVENVLGTEHLETVSTINFLGECLFCLGRIEEALARYEQALKILQKRGTLQHSQTAYNLTGLGQIFLARGQLKEAQQYLEEGLAIRERIRGSRHKYTAQTLIQLGDLHLKSGDYDLAKVYIDRVFDIRQEEFGIQHPETAESLVLLGEWYLLAQNDEEKAKSLFKQARTTLAEQVVPTHVAFQRVERNLALILTSIPMADHLQEQE